MLWVQGLPAGNQVRLKPARGPGDLPRGPSLQQGAWAALTLRTELGSELEDLGAGVETGEQMIPLQASPHSHRLSGWGRREYSLWEPAGSQGLGAGGR